MALNWTALYHKSRELHHQAKNSQGAQAGRLIQQQSQLIPTAHLKEQGVKPSNLWSSTPKSYKGFPDDNCQTSKLGQLLNFPCLKSQLKSDLEPSWVYLQKCPHLLGPTHARLTLSSMIGLQRKETLLQSDLTFKSSSQKLGHLKVCWLGTRAETIDLECKASVK